MLTIEEVVKTIKAAQEAGYPPMIVINGEYYEIEETLKLTEEA